MKKIIFAVLAFISLSNTVRAQSLNFDGTDDYVSVSSNTGIPVGNNAYTLECWINVNAMGTEGIIGWGNYGTNGQVNALRLSSTGIVNYWWANDLTVTTGDISGAWHHVAVTYDGTTRKMYVDGVLSGSDMPGTGAVPSASNLTIGSTDNGEFFNGSIDELRVWNVARTQNQIQDNMYCSLAAQANLVADYTFNQGTVNGNNAGVMTLNDLSGNANTGTLLNFALNGTSSNWVGNVNTLNPLASISINAGVTSSCQGAAVTFTATAGNGGTSPSYQWLKNGIIVGTDSIHYTDNALTSSDIISCSLLSSIPCANIANSNTVSISVPSITVTGNAGICSGTTSTLTASGLTSYTWSANAGSATTATVSLTPNVTDTYTVTGTNGTCSAVATVNLHVSTTPTLNVTGNTTVCAGHTTTLTASGAASYTWSPINVHNPTISGTVTNSSTLTLYGENGSCLSSYTVALTVVPSVTVSISGAANICPGNTSILTASGASSYTWSANTGSATTSTVSVNASNTYSVTGSNGSCSDSKSITVAVNQPTVSVIGVSICIGSPANLTASGAGTYTWNTGATSNSIAPTPTANTTYTVIGENTGGCKDSATATVIVNQLPSVVFDVYPNSYCSTNSFIYLNGTPANGTFSGTGVSANQFNPGTAGIGTFTLSYIYTDGNGCSNSDTAVVSVIMCTTTGFSSVHQNKAFELYPNPTAGIFYLNAQGLSDLSNLEIYNMLGQKMLSRNLTQALTAIDLNGLNNGVYQVRIIKDNTLIYQSKISKID